MKIEEQALVVVLLGIFLYVAIGDKVLAFIEGVKAFKDKTIELSVNLFFDIIYFFTSKIGILILAVIALPFLLYFNYKLNNFIRLKSEERKERKKQLEDQKGEIESLLKRNIEHLSLAQAEEITYELSSSIGLARKDRKFKKFYKNLIEKREKVQEKLKIIKKEEVLRNISEKEKDALRRVEALERKEHRIIMKEKKKNWDILYELNTRRNKVFLRNDLTAEQISALVEEGYEEVNEYDVCQKKIIPVLVKKIMNHSATHTFLVWSVKQCLHKLGIEQVKESETRYPDLTFYHNDAWWALEIETGSLLRKKKQMDAKVKFLHRNYYWRWMFVVSNKNLLPQYRKHGVAIPRSQVAKRVKKWLKTTM